MQIADFLGPLEADRLSILFSTENLKMRNLSIAFFSFRLPLEPTNSRSSCKCLIFKPLPGAKPETILVSLLSEAVYGKKFKTYHWFLLFNVLIRTINKDKSSEAVLSTLVILAAHAAASRWNTNFKPLKSIFRQVYGPDQQQEKLDEVLKFLPYRLPKKWTDIDSLLQVTTGMLELQKPREVARIGVGYKDKGSLSSKVKPEFQIVSSFTEKEDCFDVLLRQVRVKYGECLRDKN